MCNPFYSGKQHTRTRARTHTDGMCQQYILQVQKPDFKPEAIEEKNAGKRDSGGWKDGEDATCTRTSTRTRTRTRTTLLSELRKFAH